MTYCNRNKRSQSITEKLKKIRNHRNKKYLKAVVSFLKGAGVGF